MEGCVFCNIIEGLAEATKLFEDDAFLAFLDIKPVNEGHLLIVPKQHVALINELDDDTVSAMLVVAQRLNGALRQSGLRCEGVNYFLADGEASGQEVFHLHLHLFPRFRDDGFGFIFPAHYETRPTRAALDGIGARIVRALSAS